MTEDIRLPKDRKNLTGRHVKSTPEMIEQEKKLVARDQQKTIRDYPAEARIARELVNQIQFDAIQSMYEEINLRSAGPLKERPEKDEHALVRARPKVATNRLTPADVKFVSRDKAKSASYFMAYELLSNTLRVNLTNNRIKYLVKLQAMPRPLSPEDKKEAESMVFDIYQSIFHELGHAYSFLYQNQYAAEDGKKYISSQVSVHREMRKIEPGSKSGMYSMLSVEDLEFWMEGFNELQSIFLMRDYLENHSLRFGDIHVAKDFVSLWLLLTSKIDHHPYGVLLLTVDRIIEYISDSTDVPYPVVLDSFRQLFQTKGGPERLASELIKILGPELMQRIRDVSTKDLTNSDALSVEILQRLNADPDIVSYIEEFVTDPGRISKI